MRGKKRRPSSMIDDDVSSLGRVEPSRIISSNIAVVRQQPSVRRFSQTSEIEVQKVAHFFPFRSSQPCCTIMMAMFFWLAAIATTILLQSDDVAAWTMSTVERVRLGDFDAETYYRNPKPLLIADALSPDECESCWDVLATNSAHLEVQLQHQTSGTRMTEIYDCTLEEALDNIIFESNSQESFLTFCEGLLEDHQDDDDEGFRETSRLVSHSREQLFPNDPDWFSTYFPAEVKMSDAVILAGAGATSTLHRDPFEWTGTSLCIDGTKVWRFIDPGSDVTHVDDILKSYRLDSIAWEDDSSLSAGWQSDFSLYENRMNNKISSSQEWQEMEEKQKMEALLEIGSDTKILEPGFDCSSLSMTTAVQQPGDLLLIPAHWWHQTYCLEPSVVISSQRCGKHDAGLVLRHILNRNKVTAAKQEAVLQKSSNPVDAVKLLFAVLQEKVSK
jgi:hypothetical protein